ncbi:hypothetical protein GB937_008681 [Aspergillus fischeri]|nr:hypothetical protein GB937_008681 [Aspergillus fischeri]
MQTEQDKAVIATMGPAPEIDDHVVAESLVQVSHLVDDRDSRSLQGGRRLSGSIRSETGDDEDSNFLHMMINIE